VTDHIPLDPLDQQALAQLDESFLVGPDGTTASVTGVMTVKIARIAQEDGHRWLMTLRFPSGELFDVQFLRVRVLEQIGVKADESKPNG